jgi:hypothetical protein
MIVRVLAKVGIANFITPLPGTPGKGVFLWPETYMIDLRSISVYIAEVEAEFPRDVIPRC